MTKQADKRAAEAFMAQPAAVAQRIVRLAVHNSSPAAKRKKFDDALDDALVNPWLDLEIEMDAVQKIEITDETGAADLISNAHAHARQGSIVSALDCTIEAAKKFPVAPAKLDADGNPLPADPKAPTPESIMGAAWSEYAREVMAGEILNNRATTFLISLAMKMKLDARMGEASLGLPGIELTPGGATIIVPATEGSQATIKMGEAVKAAAMRAVYAYAFSHRERIEEMDWAGQTGPQATASAMITDGLIAAMGGNAGYGIGGSSIHPMRMGELATELAKSLPHEQSPLAGFAAGAAQAELELGEFLLTKSKIEGLDTLAAKCGMELAEEIIRNSPDMSGKERISLRTTAQRWGVAFDADMTQSTGLVSAQITPSGYMVNGLIGKDTLPGVSGTSGHVARMIHSTLRAVGDAFTFAKTSHTAVPDIMTFKLKARPEDPKDPENKNKIISIEPHVMPANFDAAARWARNLIQAAEEGGGDGDGDGGAMGDALAGLASVGAGSKQEQDDAKSEDDKMGEMQGGQLAGDGLEEIMKMLDLLDEHGGKIEKSDWVELLNRSLVKSMGFERKSTWKKRNRRFAEREDIFMPGFRRDKPGRLAIAIDESGSIREDLLVRFCEEVKRALEIVDPQGVDIIHFSTGIQVESLQQGETWEPKRVLNGGTAFRPVYDMLNLNYSNGTNYDAILFFTDMYGEGQSVLTPEARPVPHVPFIWITWGDVPDGYEPHFGASINMETGEVTGDDLVGAD